MARNGSQPCGVFAFLLLSQTYLPFLEHDSSNSTPLPLESLIARRLGWGGRTKEGFLKEGLPLHQTTSALFFWNSPILFFNLFNAPGGKKNATLPGEIMT